MPISQLPTPPSTSSPTTFAADADAFIGALPVFVAEANAQAASLQGLSGGTLVADLASSGGSAMLGFLQAGGGAMARTAQSKMREYVDLEDFGTVDKTGAVEATSVFNLAAAAAASQEKGLRLPYGRILLDATALPATLPELSGRSKYGSILKFKRQAYSAGQILLNASNNLAGIELSKFSIDCDSTEFKTAGIYALVLNGSHNIAIDEVRVLGRGAGAVFTNATTHGRINNLTVDATGTATNSFTTCFQGENCLDVLVEGMRTTGLPAYSGVFGAGTFFSRFVNCHTEGTSGAFGYSLGGCAYSHIEGCIARNTSHEAFQITDSSYCSIAGCTAEWDTGFGVDAGISINGQYPLESRGNKVIGNTINNSYALGLLCANHSILNLFAGNVLRDCGVRGYAEAPTASSTVMGQYTDIAAAACSGNTFRDNKIATETGAVLNGFFEANNGGGGAAISSTNVIDNEWQGGGVITARYTFADASSRAFDLDWRTFTPTIAPSGGAITSYTVNSAQYRRRGASVEMTLDITITNAGTGSGTLTILFGSGAPNAATNGGFLSGKESGITGKMCGGVCNAGGIVVIHADTTTVIATGARVVLSGIYRIA